MSRFNEVFLGGTAFLPVIHVVNEEQMHRNLEVALQNGADGVFLIGHSLEATELQKMYASARAAHPQAWIGVNYLSLVVGQALSKCKTESGLWADDAEIEMTGLYPEAFAARNAGMIEEGRGKSLPQDFLYFGGVHFKGGDQESDPAEMARIAYPFMDVVTTSGPGTGKIADPKKIEAMKLAMEGEGVLGLASGCTPENVRDYKDHVSAFLVATGVSKSFHELDPEKVALFAKNCR